MISFRTPQMLYFWDEPGIDAFLFQYNTLQTDIKCLENTG